MDKINNRLPKLVPVGIYFLIIIGIYSLVEWCLHSKTVPSDPPALIQTNAVETAAPLLPAIVKLQLLNSTLRVASDGYMYALIEIKNVSGRPLKYADADIAVLKNGYEIEIERPETTSLADNEVWKFRLELPVRISEKPAIKFKRLYGEF